jgi:ribosomal-protein-alanine N-acetyltransferase
MSPDDLARLHAAAFTQDRPWSAAEFASLQSLPGTVLLGDARAILLARVTLDEAEVLTLATDPRYQRQGLASALLLRFHERARAQGATRALLEVAEDNAPARALYAAHGYEEAGRRRAYYARKGAAAAAALVLSRDLP